LIPGLGDGCPATASEHATAMFPHTSLVEWCGGEAPIAIAVGYVTPLQPSITLIFGCTIVLGTYYTHVIPMLTCSF
jgi:hypothetical protein